MRENEWWSSDPVIPRPRRGFVVLLVSLLAAVLASAIALGALATPAEGARYSTTVDNANPKRFSAPGVWQAKSAFPKQRFGKNYASAKPGKGSPAKFKVKIPSTGRYTVLARWPAGKGHNAATRIGVVTSAGTKWVRVNQRKNGGKWMRIGNFRLSAGDGYKVLVSRIANGGGRAVADAVRVVGANSGASQNRPTRNPDSLIGRPIYSQAKATSYARSAGSTKYILQAIPHYYRLAPKVGIAPDVLVAQAMLETGYGRYGGDSRPWNMAGIKKGGIVGDSPRDFERPATARAGVRMHVNHMAAYTNKKTIGKPHDRYYDARSAQKNRGFWVSRISQLGDGVWATDPSYSSKIRRILDEMK